MFKILSAVALFSICVSANAFFDPSSLKTKDIVRAKLWYQGVAGDVGIAQNSEKINSIELREEVSVAVDLLIQNK